MKAAVERVLKGRDRVESDRFVALRSHYVFDSFFLAKAGVLVQHGAKRGTYYVAGPPVIEIAKAARAARKPITTADLFTPPVAPVPTVPEQPAELFPTAGQA